MARSYTRKGNNLPVDRIREVFAYDPEIGTLKWNIAFRGVAAGSMAGYLNPAGNYVIGFDRQTHQATRIAWAHHYGVWPDGHIVPANGVKHDIRILNLKHQSRAETVRSSKMRTTNKSGYRGVSWNARERKWVASISRDYRRVHLGFFDSAEMASAAFEKVSADGIPADAGSELPRKPMATPRKRWISRQIVEKSPTLIGFDSYADVIAEIGEQPGSNYVISRIDSLVPLAPGNVEWRLPWQKGGDKRKYHLSLKGLTSPQYAALLQAQGGVCARCGNPETRVDHKTGTLCSLVADHDHETQAIRGLLCNDCNRGIGLLGDTYENMISAAEHMRWGQFEVAKTLNWCAGCQKPLAETDQVCAVDGDGNVLGRLCVACAPFQEEFTDRRPAMRLGDRVVSPGFTDSPRPRPYRNYRNNIVPLRKDAS